jgi:glycosidase
MKFFYTLFFILSGLIANSKACIPPVTIGVKPNQSIHKTRSEKWNKTPEIVDISMYEINLRAFSKSADFAGVTARLDELKKLGINVIWLMPITEIGKVKAVGAMGSPYCVKNYTAVNPEFGSLSNFKTLVNEAHNRNIAVIIDWVANHTSWDNDWIKNKDWYTQDSNGNIIIPAGTNWSDVADLNYNNQEMRRAMIDALKYWVMEADIDGFRCDAADMVPFDFWKSALTELKAIPDKKLILLAEGSRADHFTAGFQMNYGWDFYGRLKDVFSSKQPAFSIFSTHFNEYKDIPAGSHKLRFTTNHDETAWDNPPMVLFNGKDGAIAASVIAMYMGGVPLLYNGQEVGTSVKLPFFERLPIDWTINQEMMATYTNLLTYHNASDILKRGTLETIPDDNVVAFRRIYQNKALMVVVNSKNQIVNFSLNASYSGVKWKNIKTDAEISLPTDLTLKPYEYQIFKADLPNIGEEPYKWSLVGPAFFNWDTDVDMIYTGKTDKTHCWSIKGLQIKSLQDFKFRKNHDWTNRLSNGMFNGKNANITVLGNIEGLYANQKDENNFFFSESGKYNITLKYNESTDTYTVEFEKNVTTEIPEIKISDDIAIYPNPAHHQITINTKGLKVNKLIIYNNSGQAVYQNQILSNNPNILVNTQHFEIGIYFVQIIFEREIISRKVIIQ